MHNERFKSWTKWKSDDIFRMWPRQDTWVNRRPSQTNYITILEAILTAFLGQSWKFQEHGFNIYVRCLAIWRIFFFTWKSDFYPSQLSIRKGLENCGFPRTFQQNNLLFSSHKNSRIRAFCSPRVRMCYTTRVEKITVTVRSKFEMAKKNWFSKHVLVIANAILKICVIHLEYYDLVNIKSHTWVW